MPDTGTVPVQYRHLDNLVASVAAHRLMKPPHQSVPGLGHRAELSLVLCFLRRSPSVAGSAMSCGILYPRKIWAQQHPGRPATPQYIGDKKPEKLTRIGRSASTPSLGRGSTISYHLLTNAPSQILAARVNAVENKVSLLPEQQNGAMLYRGSN